MAHYDLEEQEQLAALKAWWQTYGNGVCAFVLLLALSVLGWNSFSWYQYKKANEAALVYQQFNVALSAKDSARITALAGELIEKYPTQTYATLAALEAGAFSWGNKDPKTAEQQLKWASEKGTSNLKDVARLRLSNFYLDEKNWQAALNAVKTPQSPRFLPTFLDLQGDIYWAWGKTEEALKTWEKAQNKMRSDSLFKKEFPDLEETLAQKIAATPMKIAAKTEEKIEKNEKNPTSTVENPEKAKQK